MEWIIRNQLVGFSSLARIATFNIQFNVLLHVRPPIISCNEFLCLESSWMSCYDRIVMLLNDIGLKLNVEWYIN